MNPRATGRRLAVRAAFLMLPVCFFLGCARLGSVSGTVSYNGKPLNQGSIVFVDPAGGISRGTIQTDGSYTVDKIPLGEAKVAIEAIFETKKTAGPAVAGGKAAEKGKAGQSAMGPPKGALPPGVNYPGLDGGKDAVKIPEKYTKVETSGLTFSVDGGSQKKDWDLK